jgi:uncharacterized protein (DUF1778 family)
MSINKALPDKTIGDPVFDESTVGQNLMVDQVRFELPKRHWKEFCDLLDAPSRSIPALYRLLNNAGLLDDTR